MKSTTFRLGLLSGLALVAVGCGDDDGAQCGAGTVFQNGQCVAATDTNVSPDVPDTTSPQDVPDSTTQPDTDATTNPTDTFQPDTSPVQVYEGNLQPLPEGDCSSEQWVDRDVSDGCTMSCQCKDGLECMNIPYYQPGFTFCTRNSAGATQAGFPTGSSQPYVKANTHTACYGGVVESKREYFILKYCSSVSECKTRSAAYTHCGTGGLSWVPVGATNTRCRSSSNPNTDGGDVTSGRVCIIEGLFPY